MLYLVEEDEFVCLSVCVSRHHAHISLCIAFKFHHTTYLIPTPGRFSHAFRPTFLVLIGAITLKRIPATLLLFESTLFRWVEDSTSAKFTSGKTGIRGL